MTLRKLTIDNNVRYIPKSEQMRDWDIKAKTIKAGSLPRKQNKYISQNNKKILQNTTAQSFGFPKRIMNC